MPAHVYLSTACHHREHDRCRKFCKFCPAACRCSCHLDPQQEAMD